MRRGLLRLFAGLALGGTALCTDARTYLVSVGIADYSRYPAKVGSLRLPANDARIMAALYSRNQPDFTYSLLLDSVATKERILSDIRRVFSHAGPDDVVVFFFSGHGYPGGFCASDGTIGYHQVRAAMAESRCKNKVMYVDACRAGGIRLDERAQQEAEEDAKKANVILFLSSRTDENSLERADMQNGYFTTYLQMGLRGNADADRDRTITARELYEFVHDGVAKMSGGKQHPVMWGNFDDNLPVLQW